MVDYDLFEKLLTKKDEGYIEVGDFIDYNVIKLFATSDVHKVRKLFKPFQFETSYTCELVCDICSEKFTTIMNKSHLFDLFRHIKGGSKKDKTVISCDKCKAEKERRNKELANQYQIESLRAKEENTEHYIQVYLNPKYKWKDDIKTYRKIQLLSYSRLDVYENEIISYIRDMDYNDFLNTMYWKAIAERIKYKANFRCQMCNSNDNLITHHRTYEHHGDEIHHMEDLICICRDCHEKYHFE